LLALELGIQVWENGDLTPSDAIAVSAFTAFNDQTTIGWNHALRGQPPGPGLGATMSIYNSQRHPDSHFSSAQWTSCALLSSLRDYAMDRWTERNSFAHGATLLSTRTKFTCRLMADIK
jgi:hypothetical protein